MRVRPGPENRCVQCPFVVARSEVVMDDGDPIEWSSSSPTPIPGEIGMSDSEHSRDVAD